MTEKKDAAPSLKLERKPRDTASKTADRMARIAGGEVKPAPAAVEVVKVKTVPKMYRLSQRAIDLVAMAVNADTAQGKRGATLSGKLEEAIIAAYGHLDESQ
jgi:hypothetical protein